MKPSDRRFASRVNVRIPLRIQVLKSLLPAQERESVNLSEKGVYFTTDAPLNMGAAVELLLNMPAEITGDATASEWKCMGHVVHAKPLEEAPDTIGVGVRFDYYEVVGASREAAKVQGSS
ncbi:MAG TPA: PilZ domain-containing protein [Candidatus Acidoferrum sp.]|nr:PilZ domain-containing protein [Candidatus Acidoferrum sp.]